MPRARCACSRGDASDVAERRGTHRLGVFELPGSTIIVGRTEIKSGQVAQLINEEESVDRARTFMAGHGSAPPPPEPVTKEKMSVA